MRFAESCVTGILPGGSVSVYAKIPVTYFNLIFSQDGQLPAGLPRVSPTSPEILNPMARVFEAFGSSSNLGPFFLADNQMNQIKGALIGLGVPIGTKKMTNLIMEGAGGSAASAAKWMSYIKKVSSVSTPVHVFHRGFRFN